MFGVGLVHVWGESAEDLAGKVLVGHLVCDGSF